MHTVAKVFMSGNSQAVRLPKAFRIESSEVEIFRRGNEIVLRQAPKSAAAVFDALIALSPDLSADRDDGPPQEREGL